MRSIPGWILPMLLVLVPSLQAASLATSEPGAPAAAQPDQQLDQLLKQLARPPPATIAFTEVRLSPLLRAPLIVSGEFGYSGPLSLDRRVTHPYQEYTIIRGESVRVEREGEPVRTFALKRAPELQGLLGGFSALLTGDAAALHRSFNIDMHSAPGGGWEITMTPIDPKARRRVRQLGAVGRNNDPRCFTLTTTEGGTSVMLLGELASQALPAEVTAERLDTLCRREIQP